MGDDDGGPRRGSDDERALLQRALDALRPLRQSLGEAGYRQALAPLTARLQALDGADAAPTAKRLVTILFADVVGSTALSQHLGPEDIQAVMDGALERFSHSIATFGGQVLQYAGDSLLAVWGAQQAREDDARRAVRAGLQMLAQAREQADLVERRWGRAGFGLRVGVHTGPVLLGGGVDGDHSIRGIAVNIAARLEQSAPPGGLRISDATAQLLRGAFELAPQPALAVKGVDAPLANALVIGERRSTPDPEAPALLVGREAERRQLAQALQALRRPGAARQAWAVFGAPGLGKSHLVRRVIADERAAGLRLLAATADERSAQQPFGVLRSWALDAVGLAPALVLAEPALAAERWLAAMTPALGREDDAAVLGQLLGLDFSAHPALRGLRDDARRLHERGRFHALQWLRRLAGAGAAPLLLLLDDAQWADDDSVQLLRLLLLEPAAEWPLLLLLLAPEPLAALADVDCSALQLSPLDDAAARALVQQVWARQAPAGAALTDGEVASWLQQAAGHPFLLEALVQGRAAGATEAPTSLALLLQQQLDRLSPAARQALQCAAVIGPQFGDAELAALDPSALDEIEGLERAGALLPAEAADEADARHDAGPGARRHRFRHAALQAAAYAGLHQREAQRLHARLAQWLAGGRAAESGAPRPMAEVAWHYERGAERARALDAWQQAARQSAKVYANALALEQLDRALALAPPGDRARRHALLMQRQKVLALRRDRAAWTACLDELQALVPLLDDPTATLRLRLWQARHAFDGGEFERALSTTREVLAAAPPQALALRARAHLRAMQALGQLSRAAEAAAELAPGLDCARRCGRHDLAAALLNEAGMLAHQAGRLGEARALYEQAVVLYREDGDHADESATLSNLGYIALSRGEHSLALQQFENARQLAARIGARGNEGLIRINLALALQGLGDAEAAHAQAAEAQALLERAGQRWGVAAALRVRAQATLDLGHLDEARGGFAEALAQFEALGLPHQALEARAGLADCAWRAGRPAEALAEVEAILAALDQGLALEACEEPLRIHATCAAVLAAAGDGRAAACRQRGRDWLLQRAAAIDEPTQREAFLHGVPWQAALLRDQP